jgi:uncharacterized membrane protein YfcA
MVFLFFIGNSEEPLIFILASLFGVMVGKRWVEKIPSEKFRDV